MRSTFILLACVAGFSGIGRPVDAKVFTSWKVGEEREVDEGYYFTLLDSISGWRLWRIESKNAVECRAVKSAKGKAHPVPIGASVAFGIGQPFIGLYWSTAEKRVVHFWRGDHFRNSRVDVRRVGERFWTEDGNGMKLSDGEKLEVNIVGWEYPAIRVGYSEARGTFDLTGFTAMSEAVQACYFDKSRGTVD